MAMFSMDEQVKALLESTIYDLLRPYIKNPTFADFRRNFSVTPDDILAYLRAHPGTAASFFQANRANTPLHDVPGLDEENNRFSVFAWDHGTRRWNREFATVEEAVTEYLVDRYGLRYKVQ